MHQEQRREIEQMYLDMFGKMRAYASVCLENDALAEEAVQETFSIACQKPEMLFSSPNTRGWLMVTLKNTIRNIKYTRIAAKKLLEQYLVIHINEISFAEDRINLNILYDNVSDTEEFKLLTEFAVDGLSYEEMANTRGISCDTCRKRVQRAKEKISEKIKN